MNWSELLGNQQQIYSDQTALSLHSSQDISNSFVVINYLKM